MAYSKGPRRELTVAVAVWIDATGRMLRQARTRGGWTQRQVAKRTGLAPSSIQYIEQGRQIPALDTLLTLAEFYGLHYDLSREKEVGDVTLIDSGYIDWCAQCGAALMPENRTIHADWHQDVDRRLRELTDGLVELERERHRELDARREAIERGQ